jgi:hypothetical protein
MGKRHCGNSPNAFVFSHTWVFAAECSGTHNLEVSDMNHCDFHYSHLLPKKPGILPLEETMTKQCRRCGAEFVTRSRIRKRCDACQSVVSAEKQKKANERLKARRAARRMCLLKAS